MGNSNTFSRDVRAAKSNKGVAKPKDKIIGNSSTEDWLDAFDTDEERSREGYKDTSRFRNEPYNNIYTPTGMIDMSETGIPLMANGQYLPPYSGIHNMRTPYVTEERMARNGGALAKFQNVGPVTPNTLNANDFIYSPEELSKFQNIYQQRFDKCQEGDAACLEQANNYYNLYVAPKLNAPNSWSIIENMHKKLGSNKPNKKSYNSWDLPGLYKQAGAKVYLAASPDKPLEQQEMLNKMSPQERKDYWKKMNLPMGALVNFGTSGLNENYGKGQAYNTTQGLVPGNHSGRVTGYDPEGVPYIYDFGQLTPITDPTFSMPLVSITAPQEIQGYTFENLNKQNKLQADRMFPLTLNTKNAEYDEDEYNPFINSLTKNKESYANAFGMTNEEYDDYAKHAAALALTETKGGDDASVRWKGIIPVPSYLTDKMGMGDTKGITQINAKVLFGKKSLADKLSVLGITKDNFDPWNSDHISAATMALLKDNKSVQNANAKKAGNKADLSEAEKTYYQWSMPGTLVKGQAKGDSEKIKSYLENYGKIQANFQTSASPIAEKEMGGESGWLDDYDLPKAQPGLQAASTYPSAKEQNTLSSMPDKRRAYEQNLANEKANREYNAIKGGLNVAGLFYYPASVAASALEFSEGNYGQGAVGLVPFVGPASRANTARNILNQASRNLLTKSYNAGIPYKIAAPIIKGAKKTTMYGANAVNAQDAYDAFTDLDEQRYGGVKKYKGLPKGTTKNLVRGINKLFLPDPKLFGPFGRKVFDPNSKFEYGGWLDDLPKAQMYNSQVGVGRFGDLRSNQDNTRVFVPNLPKKPLTKTEQQEAKQYAVKQASRDLQKANEKLAKIQRIRASDKAQKEQGFPTTRQEWADQTQATGDKLSLQNLPVVGEYIPGILDVTGGIGHMASSLGSAPLRAQQEDSYMPYLNAIGAPLLQGALAGIGTKTTGEFLNNMINPFAGLNVKSLRRKPVQNAEFDPNHYEFSNSEMTDYFAQQPKRDLAEARIYEKKAAEEEAWLQEAEQNRQDELENGIDLFGDSDDPFGNYQNAVNARTTNNNADNILNTPQAIRTQAIRDFLQRDTPNAEQFVTTPSSIPPPPTYEQYLDNASYIGTTPLSREQYEYINNTPTPTSQSVFPLDASGWPDPSVQTSPTGGYQSGSYVGTTPNVQPTPRLLSFGDIDVARRAYHSGAAMQPAAQRRLLEQYGYGDAADYVSPSNSTWGTPTWNPQTNQAASQGSGMNRSPVPNAATNTTPQNYTQADIDEARRVFWDTSRNYQTPTSEQAAILQKHGNGDPPLPPDAWTEITENLKQNKESVDILSDIKKQLEKDKTVTGRVNYSDVANTTNQTLIDKTAIPSSDNLDSLIKGFEKVIANTPQRHTLRQKLITQLEDLKATKWLREEYAKEIKTKGGKAKENLSIVSSNPESSYSLKHLVDQDGNILGSVDINSDGYVGSSGLAHKYHGVNLDRLNLENTDAAQTFLEQRLLKRNEEAIENSFNQGILNRNDFETYKAGIEASAKKEASKIMQRLIENNDNKFGEALYRGIHHGIKDTRGGLKSHKHFVETTLENPISGVDETARRGKLGWNSWTRQDKAINELDPNGIEQFRMIRSLFPYLGAGYLGSKALEEQKYGGWLDSYK